MKNKNKKDNISIERLLVVGLIMSKKVALQVQKVWQPSYVESFSARMICSWCFDFYNQYDDVPKRHIKDILEEKREELNLTDEQYQDIETILLQLSQELEDWSDELFESMYNSSYVVDRVLTNFNKVLLSQVSSVITEGIQKETKEAVNEAIEEIEKFHRVAIEATDKQNTAEVDKLVASVFTQEKQKLIVLNKQSAIGQFMNNQFYRGAFVAFLGPEKVGKTFWLMELLFRAVKSGSKVLFFQAGDMTRVQFMRRFLIRLTGNNTEEQYCQPQYTSCIMCEEQYSEGCSHMDESTGCFLALPKEVRDREHMIEQMVGSSFEACRNRNCSAYHPAPGLKYIPACDILTEKKAKEALKQWNTKYGECAFEVITYPNNSLSVHEINAQIEEYRKQGFNADVVIIDYADLLVPSNNATKYDFRNQQNTIWKDLRRISQEQSVLLITATQAAASSYKKDILTKEDFSEDKRKYAHVTAMYGMNQTRNDKSLGVLRLNALVVREDEFDSSNCCYILQNLARGKPLVTSFFRNRVRKQGGEIQ